MLTFFLLLLDQIGLFLASLWDGFLGSLFGA